MPTEMPYWAKSYVKIVVHEGRTLNGLRSS